MHRSCVTLLFAASLIAQTGNLTAYPQDTTQNSAASFTPFGVDIFGSLAESHAQMLVPAAYLPGPGALLTGLSVQCQTVAAVNYASLQITLSPTTAGALSPTFANNLTAPQVVLAATGLVVNFNHQWTQIPFTTPYVHDGTSALVVDVQKVAAAPFQAAIMSTVTRADLPLSVYDFGPPGSGASTSTMAMSQGSGAIVLRLEWLGAPTMRLRSDPAASGNAFAVGGRIDDTVNGTPGSLYLNMIGVALQAAPLPPVLGLFRVNGVTIDVGTLDAAGTSVRSIPIPNHPGLVGNYFTFQAITLDAVAMLPQFTNAADCFIAN
ncbi:MAG TPA: hypothetical protein VK348_14390 [Planctomycetota bacterium]|nr:hypothetical protein [Planctomycetota bacterium]